MLAQRSCLGSADVLGCGAKRTDRARPLNTRRAGQRPRSQRAFWPLRRKPSLQSCLLPELPPCGGAGVWAAWRVASDSQSVPLSASQSVPLASLDHSACLSGWLFVGVSVCLSLCPSVYLSVGLLLGRADGRFVRRESGLRVCVCVSGCVSLSLSMSPRFSVWIGAVWPCLAWLAPYRVYFGMVCQCDSLCFGLFLGATPAASASHLLARAGTRQPAGSAAHMPTDTGPPVAAGRH